MQKFYDYAHERGISLPADLDGSRFTGDELFRIYHAFISEVFVYPLRSSVVDHAEYWIPYLAMSDERNKYYRYSNAWYVNMHPDADPMEIVGLREGVYLRAINISKHLAPLTSDVIIVYNTPKYVLNTSDIATRDRILDVLNTRCHTLKTLSVGDIGRNFTIPKSIKHLNCWEIPNVTSNYQLKTVTCGQLWYAPYPLISKKLTCLGFYGDLSSKQLEIPSLVELCANAVQKILVVLPMEMTELLSTRNKCGMCRFTRLTELFICKHSSARIGGNYCVVCRNNMRLMQNFGFHVVTRFNEICIVRDTKK